MGDTGFVAVGNALLGATGIMVGAGWFTVSPEQPISSIASSRKTAAFAMEIWKQHLYLRMVTASFLTH